MKFFTDKRVINDYLLIKIGDYLKLKNYNRWKEIFIDPGVYELTRSDHYSWEGKIDVWEFLDSLPNNTYFSYDYPCDMNVQFTKSFIRKTWENSIYSLHPQYICTAQYSFSNYQDFKYWFDKYNALRIESGILGLGNMCRFRALNDYLKHSLDYAFSNCRHPRIHIYGLCMKAIPYAEKLANQSNIEFSFDSTKWTRPFKKTYLGNHSVRTPGERQLFFDLYKAEVEKRCLLTRESI